MKVHFCQKGDFSHAQGDGRDCERTTTKRCKTPRTSYALGLFGNELLLPAADCAIVQGRYWAGLGENESQRRKRFDALSGARTTWTTHARAATSRALADVRQYEFDAARLTLIPPKKKKSNNDSRRDENRKNRTPGLA